MEKYFKKINISNFISEYDEFEAICKANELITSGQYSKNLPTYQTLSNLFQYKEFSKFLEPLLLSIPNLPEQYLVKMWCYVDFFDNWKLKDREDSWHIHSEYEKNISAIYYLYVPEVDNEFSGTEFENNYFIKPEKYTWFTYPSNLRHRPGIITTNEIRCVLAADIYL
jgi:hypothetical protein